MTNGDVPYSQSSFYDLLETLEDLWYELINYPWPHWIQSEWQLSLNETKENWEQNDFNDFIKIMYVKVLSC